MVGKFVSTSTNSGVRINSLDLLDYLDIDRHGVALDKYYDHFTLAFDLISTEDEVPHFINPHFLESPITVDLNFVQPKGNNVENF